MSHSAEPSDSPKPVVKDKNPHNYRKVGYSLIVISVSLVLIGLLILFIGDNYHFSGDIMAKQEIDSMTPKAGYDIVAFDYTQPIGAKLQLLGHTSTLDDAKKLRAQHTPDYNGQKGQVLIFDTSIANNTQSISLAEVYAMTPTSGYNVVSFNTMMPVGARLSPQTLDAVLGAAVNDSARYSSANVDKQIEILTFTSSFEDNLQQILGSKYDPMMATENINQIKLTPAKLIPPPPAPVVPANVTVVTPIPQNVTSATTLVNSTISTNATEKLAISTSMNQTNSTSEKSGMPTNNADHVTIADHASVSSNHTSVNSTKTVSLSENVTVTSSPK
ncbi:protein of unknown function [Nitrosotalea devaniterrae]|uniref:Uncharacterized protein n=1 Tax=Nitrosotalea devaniterrae TaxID=1078905 RepID=A0A128A2R8_9ARCH|nr:protein of unknown function [Candidatus Nitrosotalea devanaterra]